MGAKILIVDDETDIQDLLVQRFELEIEEGEYTFVFAQNGADALEKVQQHTDLDMVVTDINMPVMNGIELLTQLKGSHPWLKTLVVSAYGDMDNIRKAMQAGAVGYLTKPINFREWESKIAKTLEKVQQLKQEHWQSKQAESPSTSVHDLKTLILSFHPLIAIETPEEGRVMALLQRATQDLNLPLFDWSVTQGLSRVSQPNSIGKTREPLQLLNHLGSLSVEAVFVLKDFTPHLGDPTLVRRLREVTHQFSQNHSTIVLVGRSIQLPTGLQETIVYYQLKMPDRAELYETVRAVLKSLLLKRKIKVELQPADWDAMLQALRGLTLNQARQVIAYAALIDEKLSKADIQRILDRKIQFMQEGGILEYFPAEDNSHELGGFANLKAWLKRAKVGFTPQAQALNLQAPKGVLFVGIQGCGKSLAAKVIAREWQLPLIKLDAGRLYDRFVGESEKNFRRAITLAESMAPTILWIDEIEKSFSNAGSDADGGLSQRLFGSLLTWMQEKNQDVFLVATANDLSQLPPELLRKGRFDEIFFVDLPDPNEREAIFHIHLTFRKQNPGEFALAELVNATDGFSGAEIEQVIIAALYRSLYIKLPLNTAILLEEIRATLPLSVSRREDVERLKKLAHDRFVGVR